MELKPPFQSRRRHDRKLDAISRQLDELENAHHRLESRFSLKKNGDTWKTYLGKVVTPERVMLLIMLIYQFGGQMQRVTTNLEGLDQREQVLTQQHHELTAQMRAARDLQNMQGEIVMDLMAQTNRLSEEGKRLEEARVRLTDDMRRTVKRDEFERALKQQLLPRIDRIERALGTK